MTGAGPGGPETLQSGNGHAHWPGADWAGDREVGALTRFGRRHRRWVTFGAAAAVAAGGLGYHWYQGRPPPVPAVQVSADRTPEAVPLWSAGRDGRPTSELSVTVSSSLAYPGARAGSEVVTPVGLAGPGLSSPGAFPRSALGRHPASVELTGQVACEHVPIPVPMGAYSILIKVADGGRSRLADLPLGSAGPAISERVTTGCSTWLAARDVTLTHLDAAVVDPVRPHVDLTMTVTNRGGLPALLWIQDQTGSGVRTSPVDQTVPAHGRTSVRVGVDLNRCWTWDDSAPPVTALSTPLGLSAAAGVSHPIPADQVSLAQAGGLVLSPAAAGQLHDAFVQACGGVSAMVLLSAAGGATYDAKKHRLTVRVLVDTPPGVVHQLRLLPSAAGGTDLVPLFGTSPWLVPDQSGQAGYVVVFSVPTAVPCLGGGPFVALDVLARTGTGGPPVRVIRFALAAETFLPPDQLQATCGRG